MNLYEDCKSRATFMSSLNNNPGLFIICLSATWCKPCQNISQHVTSIFEKISSDKILCAKLDVDHYGDLYAFLKSRRMVHGIPTLLCYKQGNLSFVPDDMVSGSDIKNINNFINRILSDV